MYAAAPRLEPHLIMGLVQLDDRSVPIAETYRRSRTLAEELDIPRPSYECVRLLVHAARRRRARRRLVRDVLIDVALHTKPVDALYDLVERVCSEEHPRDNLQLGFARPRGDGRAARAAAVNWRTS